MQLNLERSKRLVPNLRFLAPNIPPKFLPPLGHENSGDPDLDI